MSSGIRSKVHQTYNKIPRGKCASVDGGDFLKHFDGSGLVASDEKKLGAFGSDEQHQSTEETWNCTEQKEESPRY